MPLDLKFAFILKSPFILIQEGSSQVPDEILPMTMEKLADQVEDIIQHFQLKNSLGLISILSSFDHSVQVWGLGRVPIYSPYMQ